MCTINDNHIMYGSWDMRHDRHISCHYGLFFAILRANNLKNQNFEKLKKTPEDITILHMCTINDNQMKYGSSDVECNRQIFLSFWTIFCPFTPVTTQNIKILKTFNCLEILPFYTCVPQITIIWCMVPEISSMTDRTFFSFWTIFCPFTP